MEWDCYLITAKIQKRHWWYEGRRRIISSLVARLGLPADAAILEAGCGTGANLAALSRFGRVSGFDPSDYAVEKAAETAGCRIVKGGLPDAIPFAEAFDLVCAFDVIEHIEDDAGSVEALCRQTKPGGYAIFTVPAFAFLWSRHDDMNHHKRRYRKAQFLRLLQEAGYEVAFLSYYNMWLFPVAAGLRLVRRTLGIERGSDAEVPGTTVFNGLLCAIFSSERFLLRHVRLPVGLSLIAVCRKAA